MNKRPAENKNFICAYRISIFHSVAAVHVRAFALHTLQNVLARTQIYVPRKFNTHASFIKTNRSRKIFYIISIVKLDRTICEQYIRAHARVFYSE